MRHLSLIGTNWRPLVTTLALLVPLLLPAALRAERFADDPVEALRQSLKQQGTTGRRVALEKRAAAVKSLGEIARALLLREWALDDLDRERAEIDRSVYTGLADRFDRAAKEATEGSDPLAGRAVANLLGEMAATAHSAASPNTLLQGRLVQMGPAVVKLTQVRDPQLRLAAVRALGRINPEPQVAAEGLGKLLTGEDVVLRRAAADALANLVRVRAQGEKEKPAERLKQHRQVADVGSQVVPAAAKGLTDRDAEVRRLALTAIQQVAAAVGDLIVVPPALELDDRELIQLLAKDVEEERMALLPVLTALADQVLPVARLAGDPDTEVRILARRTLEDMAYARQRLQQRRENIPTLQPAPDSKPDKGEPKDKDKTQGPGGRVAPAAFAQAAADVPQDPLREGLKRALDELTAGVADRNVEARLAAIEALEMLGKYAANARVTRALIRALADPVLFVRWAAARTLGRLQFEETAREAVPRLEQLVLCDPDLDVRLAAAAALEQYGPLAGAAVPGLAKAVGVGDAELRVAVIRALQGIGTDAAPAIPALTAALGEADPRVRKAAADLLGKFGDKARSAVPTLRRALDDPDADVRRAASDALLSILNP